MKKVVISQPRYLPAINYIQRLYFADVFVLLDNVQRQSRGIENRNKILLDGEVRWLTMPISSSSREVISNTIVSNLEWIERHKKMLSVAYHRHANFRPDLIEQYYNNLEGILYTQIINKTLNNLSDFLGFAPNIVLASSLKIDHTCTGPEKLYQICSALEADMYISGSNGRQYGVKEHFIERGNRIKVRFHDFEYPEYKQYGLEVFYPWMCFFDLVFNLGVERFTEIIKERPLLNEQ